MLHAQIYLLWLGLVFERQQAVNQDHFKLAHSTSTYIFVKIFMFWYILNLLALQQKVGRPMICVLVF
jgi:hypothetical protein